MTEQVQVPDDGAGDEAYFEFAMTYNAYELHDDGFALLACVRERWEQTRDLGDDVDHLRACLFLEARDYRVVQGGLFHTPFERDPFVYELVSRIRHLSGGSVPRKSQVN